VSAGSAEFPVEPWHVREVGLDLSPGEVPGQEPDGRRRHHLDGDPLPRAPVALPVVASTLGHEVVGAVFPPVEPFRPAKR
jgi:hypothetical protein